MNKSSISRLLISPFDNLTILRTPPSHLFLENLPFPFIGGKEGGVTMDSHINQAETYFNLFFFLPALAENIWCLVGLEGVAPL